MKTIFFTACLMLTLSGCSAQDRRLRDGQQKKMGMEKFNIERFDAGKSADHLLIRQKDGTEIEQWESTGNYYTEETRPAGSSFSTYKLFYFKTGNLKMAGRQFFRNKIGVWEQYDEAGKLIESTDHSKPFKFGIEELSVKMRKMGVDILTPGRGVGVLMENTSQPTYTVIYPISATSDAATNMVLVDGINGRTLKEEVVRRKKG